MFASRRVRLVVLLPLFIILIGRGVAAAKSDSIVRVVLGLLGISAGAWIVMVAALLIFHKVERGKLWGSSPAGNLLMGLGALSAGLLTIYGHFAAAGYAVSPIGVGAILDIKARKARQPEEELS